MIDLMHWYLLYSVIATFFMLVGFYVVARFCFRALRRLIRGSGGSNGRAS
jgi:hypothetical protein